MDNANSFVNLVSVRRLKKYGDVSEILTNKRFFFNLALVSAMYPMLSMFEIILQNKIDTVLSRHMDSQWLFEFVHLDEDLADLYRIRDRNVLIDRLTLGFWSRLFRPVNNEILWHKYPNLLHEIFENRHSRLTISQIHFELEQVRNCRNRISHNGSLLVHRRRQFSCRQIYRLMRRLICEMGGDAVVEQLQTFDYFELILRQGYAMGLADNIDMGDWLPAPAPTDATPTPTDTAPAMK